MGLTVPAAILSYYQHYMCTTEKKCDIVGAGVNMTKISVCQITWYFTERKWLPVVQIATFYFRVQKSWMETRDNHLPEFFLLLNEASVVITQKLQELQTNKKSVYDIVYV